MAGQKLTLQLDAARLARLRSAADLAGESADAFAARLLARALDHDDWAISEARLEAFERTGVAEDAETVFSHVREHLRNRLAERPAPAK